MMFSFLQNLFDKVIFTATFIVGVQCPAFIFQYTHQLSGHLSEAKHQLASFQHLADLHYQGDIELLIKGYRANGDQVIVETGTVIENIISRVDYFAQQISALTQHTYINKLWHFSVNMDLNIARQTSEHFNLTIPLQIEALSTGVLLAIVILVVKELIVFSTKLLLKRIYPELMSTNS